MTADGSQPKESARKKTSDRDIQPQFLSKDYGIERVGGAFGACVCVLSERTFGVHGGMGR